MYACAAIAEVDAILADIDAISVRVERVGSHQQRPAIAAAEVRHHVGSFHTRQLLRTVPTPWLSEASALGWRGSGRGRGRGVPSESWPKLVRQ
eukprot:1187457-Prorocentrum_minimum.AAC.2